MTTKAFFVAVHAGAGYHSFANEKHYQRACHRACQCAALALQNGADSTEAVRAAIAALEDSEYTNAGYGSNLNLEGCVECDASIMDGATGAFGAVGATTRLLNPIDTATLVLKHEQQQVLSHGRVPPLFLVSTGAEFWAAKHGVCLLDSNNQLISAQARERFDHYQRCLAKPETPRPLVSKPTDQPNEPGFMAQDQLCDTVGAVCIDASGNIAAGVSSGGIALKHPGRIGEAAMFGAGCWAEQGLQTPFEQTAGVGCSTSGTGEQIMRTLFAKTAAQMLAASPNPYDVFSPLLQAGFLDVKTLNHYPFKQVGFIAVCSLASENGAFDRGE
ncbi:hypothetical protein H4R35_002536 [Dimargaris xerosporica]|nr:hypothetical protein H4R35_002536 [Dimargaris xerosporica]